MKRIFRIVCVATLALFSLSAVAQDRAHTLKIYNWADYIDEDVLTEFKTWYKEQTGEDVEIIYQLFDINEIMLAKIEKGHEDYDLACPSDYIIERMLRNDLLLPLNKDFGETPNYLDNISPYIVDCFNKIDGSGKNANDYAVGYMWGTTGFLYNTKYVTEEEVSTWNALANDKFGGKLFVKDAFRDVYGPLLMFLKRDEIAAGKTTRAELMYDSSDESIALVENYLKSVKHNISGWEADFGKEQMTKEKGWLNLTWSGDAVWAIEEAAEVNVPLAYTVPQEGSNVWFDGWVIPKYAKNVKAAMYFIDFMCRPDIAIRNMEAIGYVSAVGGAEVLESQIDENEEPANVSYFFGEGNENVRINTVRYPDQDTIDRCEMMHDSGDRTEKMLEMWSRVKGSNLDTKMILIIIVIGLAIIGGVVYSSTSKKRHTKRRK